MLFASYVDIGMPFGATSRHVSMTSLAPYRWATLRRIAKDVRLLTIAVTTHAGLVSISVALIAVPLTTVALNVIVVPLIAVVVGRSVEV